MKRRSGPPPQPTKIRILHGDPGKRGINRGEPKPDAASTTPPGWLDRAAREVWNELAPELHRLGLLTKLDRQALASACRWWALYRKADATLRRGGAGGGLTMKTPSNGRQAAPEVQIALKSHDAAMRVFERFGVTPSERTKLVAPGTHGEGDDDEHLLGKLEQPRQRPA